MSPEFPPFVDNHCHILPAGLQLLQLDLSDTRSHEEVLDKLSQRRDEQPEGWLLAVHYDQNRYGGNHLNRLQLDAISSDRPILLRHSSGHAGVANSFALELAGVDASLQDEQGGSFERGPDGSLSGVVLENALERVSRSIPKPTREEMVLAILTAAESMSEMGIALASDMQTGCIDLNDELWAYREAAAAGCKIAMRLYLQWGRVFGKRGIGPERLNELVMEFDGSRSRIQGIKLFADGAIGAGTAAIYGSYADKPSNAETSGILMYRPEQLTERVVTAAKAGWQVSVHAIGDHASDLVMDAFEATQEPSRHRLEHAMLLSDAQIERLQKLDCFVSVQPEFLSRFGETYLAKLGPELAFDLIRFRSLADAGVKLSFSSDRPITTGDPRVGIALATHRPSGFNPLENVSHRQALHAYTVAAAEATGDSSPSS
jgi:predicted amidohydrolase YtcJ